MKRKVVLPKYLHVLGQKICEECELAQHLANIVQNSNDAIISQGLDGIIMSWNKGAEKLYGWTTEEAIDKPNLIIIPSKYYILEQQMLEDIIGGSEIKNYETTRLCKDGSIVEVSITASPVRNIDGKLIAISKIARDITEKSKLRKLMFQEMRHRIMNLFTVAYSLVSLSAREIEDKDELTEVIKGRILSLAQINELLLSEMNFSGAPLHTLLKSLATPYGSNKIQISGEDYSLKGASITAMTLIIHELLTNAIKYGALSKPDEMIFINTTVDEEALHIEWTENYKKEHNDCPITGTSGFGSTLIKSLLQQLDGKIKIEKAGSFKIFIDLPLIYIN